MTGEITKNIFSVYLLENYHRFFQKRQKNISEKTDGNKVSFSHKNWKFWWENETENQLDQFLQKTKNTLSFEKGEDMSLRGHLDLGDTY